MDDLEIKFRGRSYELGETELAESGPWIELKLSAWLPQSGLQDVVVRCPASLSVAGLAARLVEKFEPYLASQAFGVESIRAGELDPAASIADVDLLSGDEITILQEAGIRAGGRTLNVGASSTQAYMRVSQDSLVAREGGMLRFNRPPRVARPVAPVVLEVPIEPVAADRRQLQYAGMLIPVALGGAMAMLLKQPLYLLFMLMSPLMLLATWVSDQSTDRKNHKRAEEEYSRASVQFDNDLATALADEVGRRRFEAPSVAELAARARERLPSLWERRPLDEDFISLSVGSGQSSSRVEVRVGRDPAPLGVRPAYTGLTADVVPQLVDLPEAGIVGLYGDRERASAGARWLTVQAACLHDPSELAIVALVSEPADWEWLKWLPHVDGRSVGCGELSVACTATDVNETVRNLRALIRSRAEASSAIMRSLSGDARTFRGRWVMLLVDESAPFDGVEMARLLDELGEYGTTCIWLGSSERALPGSSKMTLGYHGSDGTLRVTDVQTGEVRDNIAPEVLNANDCLAIARNLAPVKIIQKEEGGFGLPERVSTSDANRLSRITANEIRARWRTTTNGLPVTLGESATGPLTIDLERDGPHGLVAGTTGSGKSEFLQNFVTGLAINQPPDRVSFLFIDYKGGSAFKDCVDFPHSVGMVTDLDEHLAERVLVSLKAELRRRERLLREHGAKDLQELRANSRSSASPSLLIVVDEFAALVSEVPAFVDGLLDIAQRGRSLGVHLILATQKPGGNVSPAIRANTNLRVALQTANEAESSDIIEAPDAARISRENRGRAYVRLGHDELVEFQSAYTGDPALDSSSTEAAPTIEPFTVIRPRSSQALRMDSSRGSRTELSAFSAAFVRAAAEAEIPKVVAPWLPPLTPLLRLDEMLEATGTDSPTIGLVDDPAAQRQVPLELNLREWGNALIYGAGGSGKTSLLRTIAAALSVHQPPHELAIYGLDCAGRALADIQALPNVGSVVPADDAERTHRLVRMLRETIERRAGAFAEVGATDLESYRRLNPNAENEPRILFLLDSYAGFRDRYETAGLNPLTEDIPRLIADGPPVGVHVIATGDRRLAIPLPIASLVSTTFVLQMASDDEAMALGLSRGIMTGPRRPPGRAIMGDGKEAQIALVGDNPTRESQSSAVAEIAADLVETWNGEEVPPIATLPTEIGLETLPVARSEWSAVIGVDDATMRQAEISLAHNHFAVAGAYRSGRSQALITIFRGLMRSTQGVNVDLFVPRRSPLSEFSGAGITTHVSVSAIEERLSEMARALPGRSVTSPPILLVVDDAGELTEGPAASALELILRAGIDSNIRVLATFEASSMRLAYAPWVREMRKHKAAVLLDPDHDIDGDLFGVRLPRVSAGRMPAGRGYLIDHGHPRLLQMALSH